MPIIIKDYTWKQNENQLVIEVPLKGIHPSKVDIFTSPRYVKASFLQYFFDVVLLESINVDTSKCTKTATEIVFELTKNEPNHWNTLEVDLPKKEKLDLKNTFILEEHERLEEARKQLANKKAELKRIAVREQISLDAKIKENIENIKNIEEKSALGDLNAWKKSIKASDKQNLLKDNGLDTQSSETHRLPKPTSIKTNHLIKKTKPKVEIPKPRSTRSLQVLFTPREFETPKRESKLEEENEWLRKQAEARRTVGFISEDIRTEERNPQFLKAKGDEFMKNKNYLGAVSAYGFGIKLSNKFVDLYIARSEAHLALGNYGRVIEDTSEALKLLKPALPVNLSQRALCTGRRGIGLYKLGFHKQGISELQSSLKLEKNAEFEKHLQDAQEELTLKNHQKESNEKKKNVDENEIFQKVQEVK